VKQCSILIVNCRNGECPYVQELERRGFRVAESKDWPPDDVVLDSQVVLVVVRDLDTIGMLAARMRAKPRFGRRILVALAPTVSESDRRAAIGAGFDDVMGESAGARVLIARIMRILRLRPEHRCFLPELKHRAA
jgi:DNA-binding response OmpR family regulator